MLRLAINTSLTLFIKWAFWAKWEDCSTEINLCHKAYGVNVFSNGGASNFNGLTLIGFLPRLLVVGNFSLVPFHNAMKLLKDTIYFSSCHQFR